MPRVVITDAMAQSALDYLVRAADSVTRMTPKRDFARNAVALLVNEMGVTNRRATALLVHLERRGAIAQLDGSNGRQVLRQTVRAELPDPVPLESLPAVPTPVSVSAVVTPATVASRVGNGQAAQRAATNTQAASRLEEADRKLAAKDREIADLNTQLIEQKAEAAQALAEANAGRARAEAEFAAFRQLVQKTFGTLRGAAESAYRVVQRGQED